MNWTNVLLGTRSTGEQLVPLHYPLLAVLAITAAIAPTTWFLPQEYGYYLSLAVLCLVAAYGILFTGVRLTTDPVFLVLFGGYWLGLVVQYYYTGQPELFQYVVVTPITVIATAVVLPQFIEGRREAFAMGLTVVSVCISLVGIWILIRTAHSGPMFVGGVSPPNIGDRVMGTVPIRTVSVFHNPNTYGFFMMFGSLAALYTVLARGGVVWTLAFGVTLLGLFMSEGDAAYLGFAAGVIVLLSGYDKRLALAGVGIGIVVLYWLIQIGHVPDVMQSTLMTRVRRWVSTLYTIGEDPLWGIGFVRAGPEIGHYRGPHNSYLHVLLNAGIVAGLLYLGSLIYAFAYGVRKRWSTWNGFVVGSAAGLALFMSFESLTLGGLSVSSVVLGIVIGLLVVPEGVPALRNHPRTTVRAMKQSRTGEIFKRVRGPYTEPVDTLRMRENE